MDDMEQVHELLRETSWAADRSYAQNEIACRESVVVLARRFGQVIGFARALTDKTTATFLCDLVVDPKWRGKGVGAELVQTLIDQTKDMPLIVIPTVGADTFYARYGFEQRMAMVRRAK